jgi:hypothetical protein
VFIGVAMLVPIGILAVGLPIALAVGALIQVGDGTDPTVTCAC